MTATDPRIDFTQIEFPSDKLTIKMLRQLWPDAVDIDRVPTHGRASHRRYVRHSLDNVLGDGVIDLERMLAERAFKVAIGRSVKDDSRLSDRDELITLLASAYIDFGLARGEHEVATMTRRIEDQAEAQGRDHRRQSR